jgi:hypothetical protein
MFYATRRPAVAAFLPGRGDWLPGGTGGATFEQMDEVMAKVPSELVGLDVLLALGDQAADGQVLARYT